jgi:hypothetical protein
MGSLLGGGGGPVERGRGSLPSLSLSPALPRKRVGTHALAVTLEGPGFSSPLTSWVPGSLASSAFFLSLLLVAVISKGQLKNRHPKARQAVTYAFKRMMSMLLMIFISCSA